MNIKAIFLMSVLMVGSFGNAHAGSKCEMDMSHMSHAAHMSPFTQSYMKAMCDMMEDMEKTGLVAAGSRIEVGLATTGFAVRVDAPAPDVSSLDAIKKTLLAARSVALPMSSGVESLNVAVAAGIALYALRP